MAELVQTYILQCTHALRAVVDPCISVLQTYLLNSPLVYLAPPARSLEMR